MVVGAELLTVVATAHQSNQATSVAVIDPSVPRAVTVALSLATGILRSAAPPPVIVPTPAPLSGWWIQGGPGHDHWSGGAGQVLREVTAVVFLVEVGSELLTVVAPAHQVTLVAPQVAGRRRGGECWVFLPGSPGVRHSPRRPADRHSLPPPGHRVAQECSISSRRSSGPGTSGLTVDTT